MKILRLRDEELKLRILYSATNMVAQANYRHSFCPSRPHGHYRGEWVGYKSCHGDFFGLLAMLAHVPELVPAETSTFAKSALGFVLATAPIPATITTPVSIRTSATEIDITTAPEFAVESEFLSTPVNVFASDAGPNVRTFSGTEFSLSKDSSRAALGGACSLMTANGFCASLDGKGAVRSGIAGLLPISPASSHLDLLLVRPTRADLFSNINEEIDAQEMLAS